MSVVRKTSSVVLGVGSLSSAYLMTTTKVLASEAMLPDVDDRLPAQTTSPKVLPVVADSSVSLIQPEIPPTAQRIELGLARSAPAQAPLPAAEPFPTAPLPTEPLPVQTQAVEVLPVTLSRVDQLSQPSTSAAELLPDTSTGDEVAPVQTSSPVPLLELSDRSESIAPLSQSFLPPVTDLDEPQKVETPPLIKPAVKSEKVAIDIAQTDITEQNTGKSPLPTPVIPPGAPSPELLLTPESSPPPTVEETAPSTDAPSTNPLKSDVARLQVNRIEVIGSTVLSDDTVAAIVQPLTGKFLTFKQLQAAADQITQRYLRAGYLTSRAFVKAQTVKDGVVQIQVREGSLEQIDVLGTKRLSKKYIRQRIQQGVQTPLNQPQLEDQLRLLKLDPLLANVEASLRQGTQPGQSILTVRVAEAPPIFGSVGFDNDSVPSVGSERVGLTLGYRNLTGAGDLLYGSYYRSLSGGANLWDFGYQLPLNPMQGTLNLRVAPSRYRITQGEFASLDVAGSSAFYDVSVRQPLRRSSREEFALSVGLAHRTGKTLVSDFLVDESVTSVLRFGQDWMKRDRRGFWSLNSQLNLGTRWFGATQNRTPDGQFFSWTGQLGRTQFLNADNLVQFQANWQLTPDALLPSQQFVMGGRQSLRGVRQNFRSGDNGVSLSIEHQMTLKRNAAGVSILQLTPFVETGVVWNAADNPTPLPAQRWLAALGLGLRWQPTEKWDLRLDYGLPLMRPRDRGSNLQDAALYFNFKYRF